MNAYEDHFMGALLFERDEVRRAKQLIFSHSISYPAKLMTLSHGVYTICIKLKGDITPSGVGKIVPSPHSAISVLLAGKSDPDDCDTFFQGEVCDLTPPGFDFAVLAELLPGLDADDIEDGGDRAVHMLWTGSDMDTERKMAAVQQACGWGKSPLPPMPLETMAGKPRGQFCLRKIIADQEVEYHSYPLMQLYARDHPTDTTTLVDVQNQPVAAGLDATQRHFIEEIMDGVPAATATLQGFPGSGRSKTLGVFGAQCAMMGLRVLCVA
ncbi:hypothetical protein LTR17_022820 [Elasticomyces elasticus]|nr:hypothetical protein LTR17_022820 [Elasticomyces elasticus]